MHMEELSHPTKQVQLPQNGGFGPARPRHLFLTGGKHVGKTTALCRLLEGRTVVCGGFRTVRLRTATGGAVHMLRVGKEEACSPENLLFTRSNGVLSVIPGRFDQLGCAILEKRTGCGLLVMDELGPAERDALFFQRAVWRCLEEDVPVYGVLQQGESPFLDKIKSRPDVRVVTVTEENRRHLPQLLLEQGW